MHLCTVADFDAFLASRGIQVEDRVVMAGGRPVSFAPNALGELAIYRLSRKKRRSLSDEARAAARKSKA